MKMKVEEWGIQILPECPQDKAYIRDTLGLKRKGESAPVEFRNVFDLETDCAYLEIKAADRR